MGKVTVLDAEGTHLPDQVLLGPGCRRQADTQHNGVGRGGEDAGDDGIPHVEGQHGVHHEDDEEEEGHLRWGDRRVIECPTFLSTEGSRK